MDCDMTVVEWNMCQVEKEDIHLIFLKNNAQDVNAKRIYPTVMSVKYDQM